MSLTSRDRSFLDAHFGRAAVGAEPAFAALAQQLTGGLSAIAAALRAGLPSDDRPSLLAEYLTDTLPELLVGGTERTEPELYFVADALRRGVAPALLRKLETYPTALPADRYHQLTRATLNEVRIYLEYLGDYVKYSPDLGEDAGAKLILGAGSGLPETALDGEDVAAFLQLPLPELRPPQLRTVFALFLDHRRAYAPDHPEAYLATPFREVLRNVPPVVWATDGCRTDSGALFGYASADFRHVAAGGSLRRLPSGRPLTRSMARTLLRLSPDGDYGGVRNFYVHLFALSLGAAPPLAAAVTQYVRTLPDPAENWIQLQRWDPVLQKLAGASPTTLPPQEYPSVLGYCYHVLRDQPTFSVRGRSVEQLLVMATGFYRRIAATQQRITAERRAGKRRRQRITSWDALAGTGRWTAPAPVGSDFLRYQIVELTSVDTLNREGVVMQHCVGTYAQLCLRGERHIFSLRQQLPGGRFRRLLTIDVNRRDRRVLQVLGRFNRAPVRQELALLRHWARECKVEWEKIGWVG